MNIQPDAISNISDDQELAKALAGVNSEFEEAPVEEPEPEEVPEQVPEEINPIPIDPLPIKEESITESLPTNPVPQRDELEQVKMEAIHELRPLVDKLILPPDEKFDVYLLLIRYTDDRTLVPPAHEVAKLIEDDTRRATALLDIIKEAEYLESKPLPDDMEEGDLTQEQSDLQIDEPQGQEIVAAEQSVAPAMPAPETATPAGVATAAETLAAPVTQPPAPVIPEQQPQAV